MAALSNEAEAVAEVVAAIRSIYDIARPNSERVELNKKIEEFKDVADPNIVFRVAEMIVTSKDYEETVYHAGWQFLEHLIKFKWVSIDDVLRKRIQEVCMSVCFNVSGQALHLNMSLKTAISRCFVGIMQHEWPQNLSVFGGLQGFLKMCHEDLHGQVEIIFLVVRRLLENVISMISITSAARRRDLSMTLNQVMPTFLAETLNRLAYDMDSSKNINCSTIIAKAALDFIRDLLECGPSKWFLESLEKLVDIMCLFLKHPDGKVATLATRCLETLISRKKSEDEEEIVKTFLRDASMHAILENTSLAIESSKNNPDSYEYLKAICDLLVNLGAKVSRVFEENREPQNFVLYLAAISAFFEHPSTHIKSEATKALTALLSNEILRNREDFVHIVMTRSIPVLKYVFRHSFGLGETVHDNPFDDHDYDDDTDTNIARNQLRHGLIPLVRSFTCDKRFSLQINELVRIWMEECFNVQEEDVPRECDALNRFLRVVVAQDSDADLIAFYSNLFASLVTELHNIPKTTAMNKRLIVNLSFLSALIPTMTIQVAPMFLAEIGNTLQIAYENKKTSFIKRQALTLLLRMVKSVPNEVLLQIADQILELTTHAMPHISAIQQAQLLQVTASLSNLIPCMATRIQFLSNAVTPITAFFASDTVVKAVQSLEAFMAFSGFRTPGVSCDPNESDDEFVRNRVNIRSFLTALEGLLQNVQKSEGQPNPLFGLIQPIIPVIFGLSRCVRNLYRPEAVQLLHPSFARDVFAVSKMEKEQIYSYVLETMENEKQQEEEDSQSQKGVEGDCSSQARSYCVMMNLHVQTIIGYFAQKLQNEFFLLENCKEMIESTVEDLAMIPDFRLRSWFKKTWKPIFHTCPYELRHIAGPSFAVLVEYTRNLMENRWNMISATKENTDTPPTDEDTFLEHMTCALQREFVQMMKEILMKNDTLNFWLDDRAFCDSTMLTLLNLVQNDDSVCFHKCSQLLLKIVKDKYSSHLYACDQESAVFILQCALKAYHLNGKDETMEISLLSLLVEVYGTYRPKYECLKLLLGEAVGACPNTMDAFDARLLLGPAATMAADRVKRNIMRELLHGVVKPSMAMLHKRKAELRQQPALPSTPKIVAEQDLSAVADLFGSG
ncbi:hypothetical protein L596_019347 [Steinernema carpocapsae]|uniref:Exportin-5 C-terminal domain-containing protein n=1 Tax=Steinernema carpocapsae TaxID=34508 RepID=A0A4U5MQF7_STECR|nr:hypothetical protein L596_019347 [Steinernema carpocapsae]